MKKTLITLLAVLSLNLLSGCSQWAARVWGGDITVNVPAGEQLITMTWKGTSLWLLTYNPSTHECLFHENSAGGAIEGTVHVPHCSPLNTTTAASPAPATMVPR